MSADRLEGLKHTREREEPSAFGGLRGRRATPSISRRRRHLAGWRPAPRMESETHHLLTASPQPAQGAHN